MARRVCSRSSTNEFAGRLAFVAQNVRPRTSATRCFPHTLRDGQWRTGGIIGQAFPYTPIANPRYFVPDWSFGIQEETFRHR